MAMGGSRTARPGQGCQGQTEPRTHNDANEITSISAGRPAPLYVSCEKTGNTVHDPKPSDPSDHGERESSMVA